MSSGDVRIVANIIAEVDISYVDKAFLEGDKNRYNGEIQLKKLHRI